MYRGYTKLESLINKKGESMKKILLFLYLFSTLTVCAYAQTVVVLKNGKEVEGKMVEKTDEYIKINLDGVELTYWIDEIESIESKETGTSNESIDINANAEELQRIKKVWEEFLTAWINHDIDSIMEKISPNYSALVDGENIDYAKHISRIKENTDRFLKRHVGYSISDIKIIKPNIVNNKANITFKYNLNAFDLESQQRVTYIRTKGVIFSKKSGEWKIIGGKEIKHTISSEF